MSQMRDGLPVIAFASDAEWDAWLRENAEDSAGLWLKLAKKGNDESGLSKTEAIRTALCWGWIDGQINALDDSWYLTRFTPRRARSQWSKINVKHVEQLEAEGRMQKPGTAQVEAARADGRWEAAYSSAGARHVPPELRAALDANPVAAAAFAALSSANRYAMCYRVENAKRAETKQRNVEKFVAMLERGETIH